MTPPTAYLVIPNEDRSSLLAVDKRLPGCPVGDLFRAGDVLGLELLVVRTIARLGDHRVVLCELLDAASGAGGGVEWITAARLADDPPVKAALEAWDAGVPAWAGHLAVGAGRVVSRGGRLGGSSALSPRHGAPWPSHSASSLGPVCRAAPPDRSR